MAKIKFMGSADVRRLEKGENFAGRLAEPLTKDVEWTRENNWIVDTDEAGLSAEAVELLLEDKEGFRDVSDLKKIPANLNQTTYLGMPKSEDADDVAQVAEAQTDDDQAAGGQVGSEGGRRTTTGGSTRRGA